MTPPKPDDATGTGQPFETKDFWLALLSIVVVTIAFGGTLVSERATKACAATTNAKPTDAPKQTKASG